MIAARPIGCKPPNPQVPTAKFPFYFDALLLERLGMFAPFVADASLQTTLVAIVHWQFLDKVIGNTTLGGGKFLSTGRQTNTGRSPVFDSGIRESR
jgi:hypothetical protein